MNHPERQTSDDGWRLTGGDFALPADCFGTIVLVLMCRILFASPSHCVSSRRAVNIPRRVEYAYRCVGYYSHRTIEILNRALVAALINTHFFDCLHLRGCQCYSVGATRTSGTTE